MPGFLARRLAWTCAVVLATTLVAFAVFFLLPAGDPAVAFAGKHPTPALVEQVREQLELDRSVPEQYGLFVARLVGGDEYGWPGLGLSFATRSPVIDEIRARAPVTLQLVLGAAALWLTLAAVAGVAAALRRGRVLDHALMGVAVVGMAAPVFWVGVVLLDLLWNRLGWLPGTGYTPVASDPMGWLGHMVMPWTTLAVGFACVYARLIRASLLDSLGEDHVRTARAKGLRERRVVTRHALRSAIAPVLGLVGVDLGVLVGGTVVVETVFNLPGLGTYALGATADGDLPAVMAVVVLGAAAVALASLAVDLLHAALDPRLRRA